MIIGALVTIGYYIDKQMGNEKMGWTITLSVLGVVGGMIKMVKDLSKQ